MGENSGIQWTTHTFNPWVGCQRISPGCEHCYAETYDKRVGGVPKNQRADPNVPETRWGPRGRRTRTSGSNWRQPLKWDAAAKAAGERHRVFCSSLADVFEQRAELAPWRTDLFELIRSTPHLDWLLLTKRPASILPFIENSIMHARYGTYAAPRLNKPLAQWLEQWVLGSPPANVWLGTTVEDQQRAIERIPALLSVPAVVRFLSMEPLLEAVDLDGAVASPGGEPCGLKCARERGAGIDWIIIGGESGHGARPFELAWARSLLRQARAAGVAPFVKQLGASASDAENGLAGRSLEVHPDAAVLVSRRLVDPAGGDMNEWPADLRVREFPKVQR
jgi:protein gp37